MKTYKEFISDLEESSRVKSNDFKIGDTVKFSSALNDMSYDLEGKITGFKDFAGIKDGYLVIKGTNGREYKLIYSAVKKVVNESDTISEAVSEIALKFMKEFNKQVRLLEDELKDSSSNQDWYRRIESIGILINKTLSARKVNESITWNSAEVAATDAYNDLKNDGWSVKMNSSNAVKVTHDNGCIGTLVFDPKNK
jgi:hypothetical protein